MIVKMKKRQQNPSSYFHEISNGGNIDGKAFFDQSYFVWVGPLLLYHLVAKFFGVVGRHLAK